MNNNFEFILFDLIGTTVKDSGNGDSLIITNFSRAFSQNGIAISFQDINHQRGKNKKEAIENILREHKANIALADKIYDDFMELLVSSLDGMDEMEGASTIFRILNEKGIKIGIGSGLPKEFVARLIEKIGWQHLSFDYIGSSVELGKGRPDPIMIFDAIENLGIKDKQKVLKIGDTIVDIQEGKNAGVKTAAVLTGTQSKELLQAQNPDYVLLDIRELATIIQDNQEKRLNFDNE